MESELFLTEDLKDLEKRGAFYTAKEIFGQPALWAQLWETTQKQLSDIKSFLSTAYQEKDLQIILSGAGTSAFIGDVLEGVFQKKIKIPTRTVASTDLITDPELYFSKDKPTLLISFARSGDSPESATSVELANKLSKKVFHLLITCNSKSRLVDAAKESEHYTYLMPEAANDQSLAMTGSFTSMLLAGILIAHINELDKIEKEIEVLIKYGKRVLKLYAEDLNSIAKLDFNRAVFLGSGMMRGIARESHLKLQELTDGKVICKHDTFLGLRHGPKAVIDEKTLVVYILSNNEYVNKYEIDLINDAKNGRKSICSLGIMENQINGIELDKRIVLSENQTKISEELLAVASVLPAQLIGYYKSLNLGLKPDRPSDSGMIHRVVQGVKIYPYPVNGKDGK